MPRLVAEDLVKAFQTHGTRLRAVDGVSLSVDAGEFVSIMGHSGSGKTTLLSMLGGLSRPTSGTVLFEGEDLYAKDGDALSEYRCERLGFVFQFASLLPALTATENLLLPTRFRRRRPPAGEAAARAHELLRLMGLADKADALPAHLSGGQQRRVAIARAFMNEPILVLADEPTGDLDEETEAEVMRALRALTDRTGAALLVVTHDPELARQAGRRLRMHHGKLVEPLSGTRLPA